MIRVFNNELVPYGVNYKFEMCLDVIEHLNYDVQEKAMMKIKRVPKIASIHYFFTIDEELY